MSSIKYGKDITILKSSGVCIDPLKAGMTYTFGTEEVCLLKETPTEVIIPRHAMSVKDLEAIVGEPVTEMFTDYVPFDDAVVYSLRDGMGVRPNQEDAWYAIDAYFREDGMDGGILNLSCGKGKTFLGLMLPSVLRCKTIIIAPQTAFLDNWKAELETFFEFTGTVGYVQGKRREWGNDIVFATLKTLSLLADRDEIPKDVKFGLAIFDECHSISARLFSKAAHVFNSKRLGLTATVNRTDMNEGVFLSHLGDVIFSDTSQDLIPQVFIHNVASFVSEEDYASFLDVTGKENLPKIRNWIAEDKLRTTIITRLIQEKYDSGRCIYVLAHTVRQLEVVAEKFADILEVDLTPVYTKEGKLKKVRWPIINGTTKSEDRHKILNKGRLVLATIGVGKESYNRKELDTLFILSPLGASQHAAIALVQSIGRIQRELEGKLSPEVHLFDDVNIRYCNSLMKKVYKYLATKEFPIERTGRKRVRR